LPSTGRLPALAPQHGAHARQQLGHLEGLEHVVVRAAVEPAQTRIERVTRGDDNERHRVLARAQAGQHLQPVLARQAQVQQHQVVALDGQRIEREVAIAHPVVGEGGVLQRVVHGFTDHGVVFNQEYAHGESTQFEDGKASRWDMSSSMLQYS